MKLSLYNITIVLFSYKLKPNPGDIMTPGDTKNNGAALSQFLAKSAPHTGTTASYQRCFVEVVVVVHDWSLGFLQ